ncbi:gliding motility-associated C-terminal domain-containing protein, partial [Flavobacterium sp. F-400]
NPALTAVVTGGVNGDTINYTLATSATQFSNVGAYPIVVTLGSNPNYDVTAVNGTLTVTPLKILAKDDAITETAGTTDAGNVLLDNGSGKDTLNGEQATTTLVVITVTRPATSATNSPVPVLNPTNGQVSIPLGTLPGTYEIKYEICEIIYSSNCSTATVIVKVNEPIYNPGISVLKEGTYVDKDGSGNANIGDTIQYTFVIKNTGDVDLTNVVLTDDNAVVNGGPIALLAVGATNSTTYTAVHTITQNDIDAGFVYNLATVKGSLPNGSTVTATSTDPTPCTTCPVIPTCTTCTITPIAQNPSLLVVKTSSTENYINVGDVINYTIKVTNNGNVTLAQIVVTDPLTGMNETIDTLLPGASKEYEQSYRVTQSDITNLSVTNVAFAKGKTPQNNEVSTSDDAVVDAAIVLGCGNIKVRNAFSPNGDGINEVFVIDNIDATCYPENTVEIYNRWGVLVFETKNYNNETNNFDGTSRGRSTIQQSAGLPTGTYFYILTYKSVDDSNRVENKKLDGYLYLSR